MTDKSRRFIYKYCPGCGYREMVELTEKPDRKCGECGGECKLSKYETDIDIPDSG